MVPAVRVVLPVEALVPEPLVVAVPSVVAAWVIRTVNWSAAATRLATDLVNVAAGAGGVFVYVQVMLSPFAGVIVFDVPDPLGKMVVELPAEFEQLIELV